MKKYAVDYGVIGDCNVKEASVLVAHMSEITKAVEIQECHPEGSVKVLQAVIQEVPRRGA